MRLSCQTDYELGQDVYARIHKGTMHKYRGQLKSHIKQLNNRIINL